MKGLFILCLFFILITSAKQINAQVFGPSIFSSFETSNPAAIFKRLNGEMAIEGKKQSFDKKQTIDFSDTVHGYTFNGTKTSDGEVNDYKIFRASKGGTGASEISIFRSSGSRNDVLKETSGASETKTSASASITGATYSVALGEHFGFGFGVAKNDMKDRSSISFNGAPGPVILEDNKDLMIFFGKFGTKLNVTQNSGIGIFLGYELHSGTDEAKLTDTSNQVTIYPSDFSSNPVIGLCYGYYTPRFHAEVSMEYFSGIKNTVLAEFNFGIFKIGIKNIAYSQFQDFGNIVGNQLYYQNVDEYSDTIISFGIGTGKGHSISGMYGKSETTQNEMSKVFANPSDPNKGYPTTTKATSISARYGYTF